MNEIVIIGYDCIGVQFYGAECWSGPRSCKTYKMYGKSSNCWNGIGKDLTNYVYISRLAKLPTSNPSTTLATTIDHYVTNFTTIPTWLSTTKTPIPITKGIFRYIISLVEKNLHPLNLKLTLVKYDTYFENKAESTL